MKLRLLLISALLFITPGLVNAQESATPSSTIQQEYQFLKDQAQRAEDRSLRLADKAQEERDNMMGLFNSLLTIIGLLVGGSMVGFLVMLWQTKNHAQKKINETVDKVESQVTQKAQEQAKKIVETEFGFSKKILVMADKSAHKNLEKDELSVLRKRGFINIKLITPEDWEDFDLLVFSHTQEIDEDLDKVVKKLGETDNKPLLVYSFGHQVDPNKFKSYKWHAFAQTPLTLASWVFTILTSYEYMDK